MKSLKTFLLVVVATFAMQLSFAQSGFTNWNWEKYGLKFAAPSSFKVVTNNANEFTAKLSNDLLHLSIIPWEDASLTTATLKSSLRSLCQELGYTAREIGTIYDLDLNGFEGSYAMVSKDGITMIIEGLLDQDSETNFYSIIVYADGYEEKALQIANSFKK